MIAVPTHAAARRALHSEHGPAGVRALGDVGSPSSLTELVREELGQEAPHPSDMVPA